MLYVMPAPIGEVTVIVPLDTRQVGWMVVACGAEGVPGIKSITAGVPGEIQPLRFFAVTLYVPDNNSLKIGLDL
jgi:hypothetical protein